MTSGDAFARLGGDVLGAVPDVIGQRDNQHPALDAWLREPEDKERFSAKGVRPSKEPSKWWLAFRVLIVLPGGDGPRVWRNEHRIAGRTLSVEWMLSVIVVGRYDEKHWRRVPSPKYVPDRHNMPSLALYDSVCDRIYNYLKPGHGRYFSEEYIRHNRIRVDEYDYDDRDNSLADWTALVEKMEGELDQWEAGEFDRLWLSLFEHRSSRDTYEITWCSKWSSKLRELGKYDTWVANGNWDINAIEALERELGTFVDKYTMGKELVSSDSRIMMGGLKSQIESVADAAESARMQAVYEAFLPYMNEDRPLPPGTTSQIQRFLVVSAGIPGVWSEMDAGTRRYGDVLIDYYGKGLSTPDIGRKMGVSEGTAGKYVDRGLKRLWKLMVKAQQAGKLPAGVLDFEGEYSLSSLEASRAERLSAAGTQSARKARWSERARAGEFALRRYVDDDGTDESSRAV